MPSRQPHNTAGTRGLTGACPHTSGPSLACLKHGNRNLTTHRSVVPFVGHSDAIRTDRALRSTAHRTRGPRQPDCSCCRPRTHSEPAFGAPRGYHTARLRPALLAGTEAKSARTSEVEPQVHVDIWVDISRPADLGIRRSCHPIFHPIHWRDSRGRSETVSD